MVLCALAASLCLPAAGQTAPPKAPPKPIVLNAGWEIRDHAAAPPAPQPAPPDESEEGREGGAPPPVQSPGSAGERTWEPVKVPSVFDPDAAPHLFGGTVKEYRLRFTAPRTREFRWALHFEQARRRTTVQLNGRQIGRNIDPYAPFQFEAKGLRPGQVNELLVTVDSRKDPRLPEAWWNWGGITRPVTLMPLGRVDIPDLGLLSYVNCRGPATECEAEVLPTGVLERLPAEKSRFVRERVGLKRFRFRRAPRSQPTLEVKLRSPSGRVTRRRLAVAGSPNGRRRVVGQVPVPSPELWSPDQPNLYRATVTLRYRGRVEQVRRMSIGLRSVTVKDGLLHLNNRRVNLRGASLHEDMVGNGAALTGGDFDTIVRELKELGANVTRSHYVLSEGLLRRLDRAGIMVWNQAPVWQRDHGANLLQYPRARKVAVAQVERTVKAARNHPSVITHSVANELAFRTDKKPGTRIFLREAQEAARNLDPTLPISIDTKGRDGYPRQAAYGNFDLIGVNQYFGWYSWVEDFNGLEPFMQQIREYYPRSALVMTEFGAEGRPDLADKPADFKGSYGFQEQHVGRTLDVVDRQSSWSGAIHWTLREFEIFPGWLGGAESGNGRNTRHHKGLLTYQGERKPAWNQVRDRYLRTPLYP